MKKLLSTLLVAFVLAVFSINTFGEGEIPTGGYTCNPQNPPPGGCPGGFAEQQTEIPVFTKILLEIGKIIIFR